MNDQQNSITDEAKEVADLIAKITAGNLSDAELKDAKKQLQKIQFKAQQAIEELSNRLPALTAKESALVSSQKFTLGELVIDQVFLENKNAKDALNDVERAQFLELTSKIVKAQSKTIQKRILGEFGVLKDGLYLHSETARRERIKN